MKTNIKATNIELTSEITDYLNKKLIALEKVVTDQNMFCQIELGRTTAHHAHGDVFRAEINCNVGGKDFRAVSESDTLYAAIDAMKDEIIEGVKSFKSKRMTLIRRGGATVKNIIKGFYKPFRKSR